jgi:hypothetical protein
MVIIKKILNIIKGTYYNLTGKKQNLADKRLEICNQCDHREDFKLGDICNLCGCILESKTRVEDEQCEMNKW